MAKSKYLQVLQDRVLIYDGAMGTSIQTLGLTAADFPWLFMPGIIGVLAGAWASSRLAGRMSPRNTVNLAFGFIFAAAALNLGYSALAEPALPWSVAPILVYTVGMALAMPSLTLAALDLFPQNRGLTASLLGFAHSLVSGITAGVVSPLLSHNDFTLALGMAALAFTGWIAWAVYARMS